MQVDRENFWKTLPIFRRAVEEAEFVAIDTEFSGLTLDPSKNVIRKFDPPHRRYEMACHSANHFSILQLGVCTFQYSADKSKLLAKPFTFSAFAPPSDTKADHCFVVQCGSLDFLASHKFDFNRTIYSGISWLSHTEECQLRKEYQLKRSKWEANRDRNSKNVVVPSRKFDCDFVNETREKLNTWLAENGPAGLFSSKRLKVDSSSSDVATSAADASQETTVFVVRPANAFQRLLVYQLLDQEFAEHDLVAEKVVPSAPKDAQRPTLEIRHQSKEQSQQVFRGGCLLQLIGVSASGRTSEKRGCRL